MPDATIYLSLIHISDWEFIVKMTIIMRDLMVGNPKLLEMGFKEEAIGHNAIAAGCPPSG